MNFLQQVRNRLVPAREETRYTIEDYFSQIQQFLYGGIAYQTGLPSGTFTTTLGTQEGERIDTDFVGMVHGAYKTNGVVFAVQFARQLVFTEARFMMQRMKDHRPGDLYGTPGLNVLDEPWPNATTSSLLSRMLQDADIAGNAYLRISDRLNSAGDSFNKIQIERLRPDYVVILLGRKEGLHTDQVLGYWYFPDGIGGDEDPEFLTIDEVAHWAPIPDPLASYRGMSWITPVLRDIASDKAATQHKIRYFQNGASPNVIVSYDPMFSFEQFERMKALIDSENTGVDNAYKIMHLAGGANAQVVGNNMQEIDFKEITNVSEAHICAAGRVPAIIVGLTVGLDASTYSNYAQARRAFADTWARPMWRSAAGALSTIIDVPARSRLWYDDRDVAFLREDRKDAAEIFRIQSEAINSAVREGFTAESAVAAVVAEDATLFEHTGLVSVQLQPPGVTAEDSPPATSGGDGDDEPASKGTGSSSSNGRSLPLSVAAYQLPAGEHE